MRSIIAGSLAALALCGPTFAGPMVDGSVADWERWAAMAFPASGDYVVPRAADIVRIDREADRGRYTDPNVWMIHPLEGS